jgi:ketosteroid isomerase-like protein
MSLLDPKVTFEDTVLPDHIGETYHGHEGMARALKQWMEPFEEGMVVSLERIVGSGDLLVTILRARGVWRYTGIELDQVYACLYRFGDGKIVHAKTFLDPKQALEAAGLSGQDARAEAS